jgi:hypothetical protein
LLAKEPFDAFLASFLALEALELDCKVGAERKDRAAALLLGYEVLQ